MGSDANGNPRESWAPAYSGAAITPSDATDLSASQFRALWIGGAGDVAVIFANDRTGSAVTLVGVAAGTLLPVAVKKVMSTNTTATSIVGLR